MDSMFPKKACDFCMQYDTDLRNGWQRQDGTFSCLCDHCLACDFCMQCDTDVRHGWQHQDGTFSCLCDYCFSLYKRGTFCEVYHKREGGWTLCVSCEEKFHYACIMSMHLYEINDDPTIPAGIICKECLAVEPLEDSSSYSTGSSSDGSPVSVLPASTAAGAPITDEDLDSTSEEMEMD